MKNTVSSELIITLGAPNDRSGKLSAIALSRANKALELLKQKPEAKLIITGGFGGFNPTNKPHYSYVRQYIVNKGLDANRIMGEIASSHTVDDAVLSSRFLADFDVGKITIVTSSWHIKRAKFIFQHFFEANKLEFVGSTDIEGNELEERLEHETKQLKILMRQGGVIVE